VIQARLAVPRRAALVTSLVLGAALLRAVLLPLGDLLSTAVFAACLLGITWVDGYPLPNPPHKGEGEIRPASGGGDLRASLSAGLAGLLVGAVLVLPNLTGRPGGRPLDAFWGWAAIAAVVATLEEAAIRGALYRRWLEESGPMAAILAGAIVFALIHLARYGLGAMPLDIAVGVALGGLRTITGRVMPCAIAHIMADWGAWFWA
jgi:membrane protease YdiL (CAAX protease family)